MKYIQFPSKEEYPSYTEMYMKWCTKDGSLLKQFEMSMVQSMIMVRSLSDKKIRFKSSQYKWSIKEILVHLVDDERIYAYRALAFARNDRTKLPVFEQDDYVLNSETDKRTIDNIMQEYEAVRSSTIRLFNDFSDLALTRKGIANGKQASVRALGYHILGHELHHLDLIKNSILLKNKL